MAQSQVGDKLMLNVANRGSQSFHAFGRSLVVAVDLDKNARGFAIGRDLNFVHRNQADARVFEIALDQSLLVNLEMQARWAISGGLARPGAVPNFLPALAPGPLREIDPALVTLIDGKDRR